ncbi:MAG TPA: hypothetical protein VEB03_00830 [Candidatus Nanoarchaeia archaeon]|nr:hypothetical protein [Candidatus Nanoarchaeia archaeon]
MELRRSFAVKVNHDDKPLAGVVVVITSRRQDHPVEVVREFTASHGATEIRDLRPGDYWFTAEYLGISAASFCFHVDESPSRRSKKTLTFEWGQLAPATARVAGSLIDSQPGTGGTPLWNLLHRVNVPIVDARLKLVEAFKRAEFTTVTNSSGNFAIEAVPPGTYVLHIEGGRAGDRDYDSTDLLLEVAPAATRDRLVLTRRHAGGGSCGGTSLELLPAGGGPSVRPPHGSAR